LYFKSAWQRSKAREKTVLLSSHILSEVETLCDRLSIIRNGKIIDTGTLRELRHLSHNNITVETEKPIPNLRQVSGVFDVSENAGELTFCANSDVTGTVMSILVSAGITRIAVTPPTLEELFLNHYGAQGGVHDETIY